MNFRVTGHVSLKDRQRGPVWYVKYRLADGRQVQKLLGPAWTERSRPPAGYYTRKMAQDALGELLADARRGTLADSGVRSGKTFEDACAEWLRYIEQERQRAPSTLGDYRNVVNGVLLPEFGQDTPLERITTERIDEWRERLLDDGLLARRTIQKNLVLLYGILKRAKRRKWIASNPAEDAERVSVRRSGDFNVLTPEEVFAVARCAASEQDAAMFTVAAFTGLRLGELRALRWRDIDFGKQTIIVRGSFTNGKAGPPKSGKIRSVPLIDQAARALDGLSKREMFTGPDDLVFCSPSASTSTLTSSATASTRRSSRRHGGEAHGLQADGVPRPAAHVRHPRGRGVAAARRAGVHGPRGHPDHDDLRASSAEGRGCGSLVRTRGQGNRG